MNAPVLIDDKALARNRRRAARAPVVFLHELVADEIQFRLDEVNRTFTQIVIVTAFPAIWQGIVPKARIVPPSEILALEAGSADLVIHCLSLHWANDPLGQMIQCARALRPDGLFLGAMLGGQTLSELRVALAEAESQVSGGISPRVLPMGEIRELGGLIQRAGLALPVADTLKQNVSYRDLFQLMADLRSMGEGNALNHRLRRFTAREIFLRAAAIYGQHFPDLEGRIRATFEIVFLTGWKPHESQQKPLRPGSAVHRLAEALGAEEGGLSQRD